MSSEEVQDNSAFIEMVGAKPLVQSPQEEAFQVVEEGTIVTEIFQTEVVTKEQGSAEGIVSAVEIVHTEIVETSLVDEDPPPLFHPRPRGRTAMPQGGPKNASKPRREQSAPAAPVTSRGQQGNKTAKDPKTDKDSKTDTRNKAKSKGR